MVTHPVLLMVGLFGIEGYRQENRGKLSLLQQRQQGRSAANERKLKQDFKFKILNLKFKIFFLYRASLNVLEADDCSFLAGVSGALSRLVIDSLRQTL